MSLDNTYHLIIHMQQHYDITEAMLSAGNMDKTSAQ